ncbi:MAG: type III pantothenate kinase [Rickettsiales bacterium]|nr:type III pantothenate kinase [Rickettsiales bacterium]
MLLAIDVGNTNTVFAVFNQNNLLSQWRISTDSKTTADEYMIAINQLMLIHDHSAADIDDVIISTVVPQNIFALKSLCKRYFKVKPLLVGEGDITLDISLNLKTNDEVGSDRLVNAIAAYHKYTKDTIIIDFGTATTFDVLSKDGCYEGGVIAPGINLSMHALQKAAAKLPEITIRKPANVIGKTTVEAMQAGVFWGYVGLIEGIILKIEEEYGKKMFVIATGGLAPLFSDVISCIDTIENDLTMIGLLDIYNMNK